MQAECMYPQNTSASLSDGPPVHTVVSAFPTRAALSVKGLAFRYGNTPVLRGVSFSVPRGSICGLFGPNGSGKTTLFRCCLGILTPNQGTIEIDGLPVSPKNARHLARQVAYVPQEHKQGFPFSVREIVSMGRTPRMSGFFRLDKHDHLKVAQAMELMGIAALADTPGTALSGGQRQLVSLARALAQEAPLMLLDEPTSALDFSNQMLVWRALRTIADQGVTVLVCCHDPNHILWFCDEAVALDDGFLKSAGPSHKALSPETLRELYGENLEVFSVNGGPVVRPVLGGR